MNSLKFRFSFCLLVFINVFVFGQIKTAEKVSSSQYQIHWQKPLTVKNNEGQTHQYISFKEAEYAKEDGMLPRFNKKVSLANGQEFNAEIIDASYQPLSDEEAAMIKSTSKIVNQISVKTFTQIVRKKTYGVVSFIPIRKNNVT